MQILIDTNVLFSALIFPNSKPAKALLHIANNHEIILCKQNITELFDINSLLQPSFPEEILSLKSFPCLLQDAVKS